MTERRLFLADIWNQRPTDLFVDTGQWSTNNREQFRLAKGEQLLQSKLSGDATSHGHNQHAANCHPMETPLHQQQQPVNQDAPSSR